MAAVMQTDFLVRLAEIESTSRYTHIFCRPALPCRNSFSLQLSALVSLHGVHKHASMHTTGNSIYTPHMDVAATGPADAQQAPNEFWISPAPHASPQCFSNLF